MGQEKVWVKRKWGSREKLNNDTCNHSAQWDYKPRGFYKMMGLLPWLQEPTYLLKCKNNLARICCGLHALDTIHE